MKAVTTLVDAVVSLFHLASSFKATSPTAQNFPDLSNHGRQDRKLSGRNVVREWRCSLANKRELVAFSKVTNDLYLIHVLARTVKAILFSCVKK